MAGTGIHSQMCRNYNKFGLESNNFSLEGLQRTYKRIYCISLITLD